MRCSKSLTLGRLSAAAVAVLTACGGTTGLEHVIRALGGDAGSGAETIVVGSGGTGDSPSDPPGEAGGPVDGEGADPLDAAYDRTVPTRPPPRDTGIPFVVGDSAAQAGDGASQNDGRTSAEGAGGATTYSILAAQGPSCLRILDGGLDPTSCPVVNHCFDPVASGGLCELFDAAVVGSKEIGDPKENCVQTLHDILQSRCAASQQLTPCLCGDADSVMCVAGTGTQTPNGPVYPDYVRSFNRTNGADINAYFNITTFGAGMANQLVTCLASFNCDCLDGGR
jgi:hypothetical protein